MNNYIYNEKHGCFIGDKTEPFQLSNFDILVRKRIFHGKCILYVVFGWTSQNNPLYKIKLNTLTA